MENKNPELAEESTQAKWFAGVREAHRMEIVEDYVELIADLYEINREARLSDLAKRLGVSGATAHKVLARLKKEGYVEGKPYRQIFLTPKGESLAKDCKKKHRIIVDFLIGLGVSNQTAEQDAEGIEHHISKETLQIMEKKNSGR